jgi:hypothetical protein
MAPLQPEQTSGFPSSNEVSFPDSETFSDSGEAGATPGGWKGGSWVSSSFSGKVLNLAGVPNFSSSSERAFSYF